MTYMLACICPFTKIQDYRNLKQSLYSPVCYTLNNIMQYCNVDCKLLQKIATGEINLTKYHLQSSEISSMI